MFTTLTTWLRPSARPTSRRPRRFTAVEELETRDVPSTTPQDLATGDLIQDWSNTALITTNNWANVPAVVGYSGSGLAASPGTDPRLITAPGVVGSGVVIAGATDPNTQSPGTTGVAQFSGAMVNNDATVALKPFSGAAPFLLLYINPNGTGDVTVQYDLRDLDSTNASAVQQFALQYRLGNTGNFTNFPVGPNTYVADATATNTTQTLHVVGTLPAALVSGQSLVEVRIITTNAGVVNEWVGVDNIVVHGNKAPTVGVNAAPLNYTENDLPTPVDAAATVSDSDSLDFNGGSLKVDFAPPGGGAAAVISANDVLAVGNQGTGIGQIGVSGSNVTYNPSGTVVTIGTFTGGTFNTGTGTFTPLVVTLTANADPVAVQALLRDITYFNTSDDPVFPDTLPNRLRTVRVVVADGDGGSTTVTRGVNVIPVNDVPVLALSGAVSVVEQDPPALLAGAATLTDVDSHDLDTGTLTVGFVSGATAGDNLALRNNPATQFTVTGGNVAVAGLVFGTITSPGTGGTPLVVTFNAFSTAALVQEVVRNVTFENPTDNPPAGPRNVQFVVTDGDGGTSTPPQVVTVTITPVNDPPVVTLPGSATGITYTENDPATAIDPAATVADPDSPNFLGGKLTVSFTANGAAEDQLGVIDQGTGIGQVGVTGVSVRYNFGAGPVTIGSVSGGLAGSPLVISFNALATPAAVQAVTQAVSYFNTSENPSTLTRTVQFVLTDGDTGTSTAVSTTVKVVSVLDGPTIGAVDGTLVSYQAGFPGVLVAPAGTVTDPDSANFATGNLTVSIISGGVPADLLAVRNQGPGPGKISVSGTTVSYGGVVIGTISGGTGGAPLVVALNASADATATAALIDNITFRTPNGVGITGPRGVQFVVTDDTGTPGNAAVVTVDVTSTAQPQDDFYEMNEDAPSGLTVLAPGVLANDPGGASATVVLGSVMQPANGSVVFNPDGHGGFTYTPNPDFNGTDTFTYQSDNGGTLTLATVTVIVDAVNDAPVVTLAAAPVVNEDSGTQTVTGFATLAPGPVTATDEAGQTLTIGVTNNNNALFSVQPLIAANGTLIFAPAPDVNGTATVTMTVTDDGGTFGNPLDDDSTTVTFTITVNAVNDAPTFQIAGNPPAVAEDAGPQTVSGFVTSFQPGPGTAADEATQTATYPVTVLATTGGLTFSAAPAIAPDGTLTYTAAPNSSGTATISVLAKDSGGTANGGVDTSAATRVFVITVTPVNDPPTAANDTAAVIWNTGPNPINVLANDSSAPDAGETLRVVAVTQGAHGAVAVSGGGSGLTYQPAPGFIGTDTFQYTLGDGNGGTATGAVTVTVAPKQTAARDLLVFGSGPGGGSLVRVFDAATGAFVASFTAFGPTFAGGVSVAAGDVNGDGVTDVIVGAGGGVGAATRVIVVDGTRLGLLQGAQQISDPAALLGSFYAYDPGFTGGVNVAAGDVDGDGRADIITGTGTGGGAHVKVISGARINQTGAFGVIDDAALLASFFAYDPTFRDGVNVAAGDVNGDGYADVVTGAGNNGAPHVKVFNGATIAQANFATPMMSFFAYDSSFRNGVNVAAGDVDGDGRADVITGAGVGGGSNVRVFDARTGNQTASFFAFGPVSTGGVDVAFRQRQDGTRLIAAGTGIGSQVALFTAPGLGSAGSFDAFGADFLGGVDVG